MKKILLNLLLILGVMAVAVGLVIWLMSGPTPRPSKRVEKARRSLIGDAAVKSRAQDAVSTPSPPVKPAAKADRPKGKPSKGRFVMEVVYDDPDHPYSPEDKKLVKSLMETLDKVGSLAISGDPAHAKEVDIVAYVEGRKARMEILKQAAEAAQSENPSVRMRAIEAYGFMGGDEALDALAPMMADADEEVANRAVGQVELKLQDVVDKEMQFNAAAAYLKVCKSNVDAATMLSGIMSGAAGELIEPANADDHGAQARALGKREQIVGLLADVIQGGGMAAEVAAETYRTITTHDWVSADEAKLWAQDPATYTEAVIEDLQATEQVDQDR